jgi:hypothetical protein
MGENESKIVVVSIIKFRRDRGQVEENGRPTRRHDVVLELEEHGR